MKKIMFSIFSFILAYNIFRPNILASDNVLTLEPSQDPSIYSGHASHCSHASHYSSFARNSKHKITTIDSIGLIGISSLYTDKDSLNCIVKAYVAEVQITDNAKIVFEGSAMLFAVKDDFGSHERSPRIKVTTHIIPLNIAENRYFTSNGHIGYHDLSSLASSLQSDLQLQLKNDWIVRVKEDWMYSVDDNFFKNITDLTW